MAINNENLPRYITESPEKLGAVILADKLLDAIEKIASLEKEIEELKLKLKK